MPEDRRATILVVDDDELKRYTMAHIVRRAGFDVVEAATGAEALLHISSGPDAVLLDVNLPDMSGFDVCRRFKSDPSTTTIPVVHVSATFVEAEDRVQGLDSGADAYLTDVVSPIELIATLNALLRARRAEESARVAARQWQATFDAISDGIVLLDEDGRITRGNPAAGEILGRSTPGLIGRSILDLLPMAPADSAESPLARALASRRRESDELALADGRTIRLTIDPIPADGLGIGGAVCILSDISERRRNEKALRESDEHFRMLVEGVRDYAIVMTDPENRVVSWNTGAERILGYTGPEILGRDLAIVFTPEDREKDVPGWEMRTAVAEGRAIDERWQLRKDGSRFWASGVLSPLRDEEGGLRGFAKVFRDESERKRLEEELRRRALELVEADRQKDQFLAMLAHELRNPLAPVRNALEEIRLTPGDPAAVERARAMAGRQIAHMARLIEDLLDVSRITSGKIQLRRRPVDFSAIASHSAVTSRAQIEAARQELRATIAPGPIWVDGDSTRLEQVLANLLNNATKFSDPGGRIDMSVSVEGAEVRLLVRDTGIGIGPETLPRVFDLFAQGDRSLARAQGGLGIGLTLVRSLVEMHGGVVGVHSEGPGRGAEFLVRLPIIAEPAPSGHEAPGGPGREPQPRRVLVVDDNIDSATSLARVLGLWGHDVSIAHGGPEAIEMAVAGRPDLILLDIGLPGMDGYEVAAHLRARPDAGTPTLVALTGYGQEDDRRRSREAGIEHHLVKPVDLDELQALLERVVPRAEVV